GRPTPPLGGRVGARRQACAACASLAALRRGGGGAVMLESVAKMDPHPQPLPSRLRACPLPANLKVTKPRQAGVWLGRGAHRDRCAFTHCETVLRSPPMRRRFATLDVFTDRRFAGNPLAVVREAEGLSADAMQ